MVLKERIHALADGARARPKGDEMPAQGEDNPVKRAVIHEWENWAALNPDDLSSPMSSGSFSLICRRKSLGFLISILRTSIKVFATGLFENAGSRIEIAHQAGRFEIRPCFDPADDDTGLHFGNVARFL